jgi:hypothetical protein
MPTTLVDDIKAGALDSTGARIEAVHSKIAKRFAVYETAQQVMIQFADDDAEGVNQRAALLTLASSRTEINGMLAALRESDSPYQRAKVKQYDGAVASALGQALLGNVAQALVELQNTRNLMAEDRASDIRTKHLLYAAAATAVTILLTRMLASDWFGSAFGHFSDQISPVYWTAAAIGAVGALFSIALQIRSRQVPIDLQPWDNIVDAILRIFVGATSGTILIALLKAGSVNLMVGTSSLLTGTSGIHGMIIAAFAGGFGERLVADFFSGISLGGRAAASKGSVENIPPTPPTSNERTITGETPPKDDINGSGGGAGSVDTTTTVQAGNAATDSETTTPPETSTTLTDSAQAAGAGEDAIEPNEDEDESSGADAETTDQATPSSNPAPVG